MEIRIEYTLSRETRNFWVYQHEYRTRSDKPFYAFFYLDKRECSPPPQSFTGTFTAAKEPKIVKLKA